MYDIFYVSKDNGFDDTWKKIKSKYPIAQRLSNVKSYESIRSRAFTKMFWVIWDDLEINETIDLLEYKVSKWDDMYVHVFKNGEHYDGICLFPKSENISQREFDHRFFNNKKEIAIVASVPKPFDKFFVNSYDEYLSALQSSSTEMFWVIWKDVDIIEDFGFDYQVPSYNRNVVHIFKNGDHHDGICLFPKSTTVSSKEFQHRFFSNKKEIDIQASAPKQYSVYSPLTYDEYLDIQDDMFWLVWPNLSVIDQTVFNIYFSHHNSYDRSEHHIFKNRCYDKEMFVNGIMLCTKKKTISKREFDIRYLVDKKEHDRVVSKSQYPILTANTYDQYLETLKTSKDDMFWLVWPNIKMTDESVFDLYFDPRDGKYDHDRSEHHIFKNRCYDKESFVNGVILCTKKKTISKREFDIRYLVDKKEHDRIVSKSQYPLVEISEYDDYLSALESVQDDMFWVSYPEIEIIDESVFDLYFDPRDGKYDYDRSINHVFLHHFKEKEHTYNGLMLMSKNSQVGKREIDFRYLINKKEQEIIASQHKLYDIVFISYNEPNADENWNNLKEKYPRAKRVHGVKGIHQAHIRAAEICSSEMIWIVDGDAEIVDEFSFDHVVTRYEKNIVHVWRSQNPINGLIYGYGGVKLLPRHLTLAMDVNSTDMTTSISDQFIAMKAVSNVTVFNTDPFNTWKSAFRECAKLSAKLINRQDDDETNERLVVWCSQGKDKQYGEYAIAGAIAGRDFGLSAKDDQTQLAKINDFEWLKRKFDGV